MMESILDLLGDVAEVGLESLSKQGSIATRNKAAEVWSDYMTGKRKDLLVGKKNKDSEEDTEFEDEIEDEFEDFQMDDVNEGVSPKKKKRISQGKAKKLPTLKEEKEQLQQRQSLPQQSIIKSISDINQTKLQEGIILSEILGPPVSRKRKNRIGRM